MQLFHYDKSCTEWVIVGDVVSGIERSAKGIDSNAGNRGASFHDKVNNRKFLLDGLSFLFTFELFFFLRRQTGIGAAVLKEILESD